MRQAASEARRHLDVEKGRLDRSSQPRSAPPSIAANSQLPGTIISIQVLRFVAAFVVVLFHAHLALVRTLPAHVSDQVDHAFEVGASGVHIFFVISGFVMVYTSVRSSLTSGRFLKRRLIRIYPIYWLVLATYLVCHQLLGTPYNVSLGDVGKSLLLLPHYSAMVIGPGWTLSFEMYFYLCFAIALVAGVHRGLIALSVFYVISVIAGRLVLPSSPSVSVMTDSLLLEFITGAWLGSFYARGFGVSRPIGAVLIVAAVTLFASGFWLDYHRLPSVVSWGIPSLLLVTGALAFESSLGGGFGRFFGRLGDSSYLLYLSHVLLIDLALASPFSGLISGESATLVLAFPLAIACTLVAAVGFTRVELPLLNVLKGILASRRNNGLAGQH